MPYQPTPQTFSKSKIEDVVMSNENAVEFERDIPIFNGETKDVKLFTDRLNPSFGRHQRYYQTELTAMLRC